MSDTPQEPVRAMVTPVSFTHDPATGQVTFTNPKTPGGLDLIDPPVVVMNEDLVVAVALRILLCWLTMRAQLNLATLGQIVMGGLPKNPPRGT